MSIRYLLQENRNPGTGEFFVTGENPTDGVKIAPLNVINELSGGFYEKAKRMVLSTRAAHAVYGVKTRSLHKFALCVEFFDPPKLMTDEEFEAWSNEQHQKEPGCIIFAVHAKELRRGPKKKKKGRRYHG